MKPSEKSKEVPCFHNQGADLIKAPAFGFDGVLELDGTKRANHGQPQSFAFDAKGWSGEVGPTLGKKRFHKDPRDKGWAGVGEGNFCFKRFADLTGMICPVSFP